MPLARKANYTEEDYYNLPEDVRAELIDGALIYNQAAPSRLHQTILGELHAIIHSYIKNSGGPCRVYPAPFAVQLTKNKPTVVEPDLSIVCDRSKLTERGCTGAPDWIVEITSPGNASHDYIRKLKLYADAGVREYWIVDPDKKSIFVYFLEFTCFRADAYTFLDKIKVNIYDDFVIDFSQLEL